MFPGLKTSSYQGARNTCHTSLRMRPYFKTIARETQHIKDESLQKDPQLDEYLKKVYVKSYDPMLEMAHCGQFILGFLAVCSLGSAYPLYGPKRYRAYSPFGLTVYPPRATYAAAYPYSQDFSDLYAQDPYENRFRFVQLPFYFPEAATPYYYDDEEAQADEEDPQEYDPYAQEWYGQDANAKANAYFLQNLILAEMYKDAQQKQEQESRYTYGYPSSRDDSSFPMREDYDDYVYGEQVPKEAAPIERDEDVKQLKSLAVSESAKRQQLKKKIQESRSRFTDNTWSEEKRTSEKKGQEEVVLPRPATPARTPVFHQRSYQPSAYDAIKKLLHGQTQQKSSGNRQPQKRSYIPNEDALVEQLGNLKKSA